MKRGLLLLIVVLANAAAVAIAVAPGVVTYAEVQPAGVTCATCTPEALAAIARAAAAGRVQVQQLVQSNAWLLIAIALLNVLVVGALVWRLRSNSTPHTDARDVPAPASSVGARAGGRER